MKQGVSSLLYLFLICSEISSSLLCQSTKITGIRVKGKEVLLAQFVGDAALFLDSSELSFNEAIWTLQRSAEMSCLKMNNDKRVIWIGRKKNS